MNIYIMKYCELNWFLTVISSAIINYNLHKMITVGCVKDLVIILWYISVEDNKVCYSKV